MKTTFAFAVIPFVLLACASSPPKTPSVAPPSAAVAEPAPVEWMANEGVVHCHRVDAQLALAPADWKVNDADPDHIVLASTHGPSQIVIVTAGTGSDPAKTDDRAVSDWVRSLRYLLSTTQAPDDAVGLVNMTSDASGFGLTSRFRLQPDDGRLYEFAFRSVMRGSNECRVAALTATPAKDASSANAAQSLDAAVAKVHSTDLFAMGPAPAPGRDAAVDSVCLIDLMLAAFNPKRTLPAACSS